MSEAEGRGALPFRLLERLDPRVPYVHCVRARQNALEREVELRIFPTGMEKDVSALFFEVAEGLASVVESTLARELPRARPDRRPRR